MSNADRDMKQTAEGLLKWSIKSSDPSNFGKIDREKLMSPEEFRELMDMACPDEMKMIKDNLDIIKSYPSDKEVLYKALDVILFRVEGIDQADWFADMNGFEIIYDLMEDPDPEIRMACFWIVLNATQNNPKVLEKFHNKIGVDKLLKKFEGETDFNCVKKKFGAVTCVIRGYKPSKVKFYECGGLDTLLKVCEKHNELFPRFAWFISGILNEEDKSDIEVLKKFNAKEVLQKYKKEIDEDELLQEILPKL